MREATILRNDGDIVAVAKPPGMKTVAESGGRDVLSEAGKLTGVRGLRPVHRLDRDTSGALLFAANAETEKSLTDLFRTRSVTKRYLGITLGVPFNRTGMINRRLSEWDGGRKPVRVVKGNGGLEASTGYRILATGRFPPGDVEAGLIMFLPHQGRTHQIRVHAAAFGYPLLGDDQYGDRSANRTAKERLGLSRQALHSWNLSFPWRDGVLEIACDPPEDLADAIRLLFGEVDLSALLERS
ncbi:MAG: RNA pseudouridine synthase [Planctomycetota bacterium]|nr:RNA pseudouridine synthase [Planctomycetota bacterium]